MTYVVCEPCHDCKYTDCCVVCPVECFYQDDVMLYIHPAECIDCDACMPECPVEAIFPGGNVPSQWAHWTQINADKSVELAASGDAKLTVKLDAKKGPGCSDPSK